MSTGNGSVGGAGLSDPERQAAHTQALFRLVNEKMHGLRDGFGPVTDMTEIVCECSDVGCVGQIAVPTAVFEAVQRDETRFIVVAGHAHGVVDEIIARHDGYEIVRLLAPTP